MKLQLKKITLSKIITLLFYCNIYAMMPPVPEVWIDPRMDTSPYNFTIDTPTEKITSHTINHEDRIIAIQERCDRETGEIKQHVDVQIYPEIYFRNESGQQFDLPSNLNFNNQNNSNSDTTHSSNIQQEHDYFTNKFKDDALESHRQEIESNNAPQAHTQQSDIRAIQREKALQELHKIHTSSASPKNIFSLPIVQTHLKQFKYNIAAKYENKHVISFRKKTPPPIAKAELKFADALISIKVGDYLTQIKYADSITATTAFAELKELWIWKRGHTFLTSGHQNGTGETGFIARLGIDIMQIAERNLISRPDYIAEHTDAQSFKTIQEYREKCIALQQKGDRNALFQEELRLRHELFKNGKKDDFTANVCYAIVEKTYSDIATSLLYEIRHTLSHEKARDYIHYLETHILNQMRQQNVPLAQAKDFIIKQYDFDVLEAAYKCYASRSDYAGTIKNQSLLSHPFLPTILHNIEHKNLPLAHAELVHLQKQVLEGLESLNITDPIEQKEFLVKDFGTDILEQASNVYKNRSDHQELIKSFIPLDVHYRSIDILNNSPDYASVAQQLDIMAEHVFHNARLCKLDFVDKLEPHILDSLHIIKAPQNNAEFVFNVTVVDHLLTDIQIQVDSIVKGEKISYIERGSELFTRGIVKFLEGLNPVTQITSIGHLAHDVRSLLIHPIDTGQKIYAISAKACRFLINSADFTVDTTLGRYYLSEQELQYRINSYNKYINSLPVNHFTELTTENYIDIAAQLAADFICGKGFVKIFSYLKEIDAATKLENCAAKIADKIKDAIDINLANNPALATAEGLVLEMSNGLKKAGEKIKNSSIGQKIILRVNNMKEFFELPFGQTLYPHSVKTPYHYQKFSIYKLTENIPNTDLKKGYFYYLDSLHRDHLEIFNKKLKVVGVYNLDGTFNMAKSKTAEKAGRTIKLT